MRTVMLSILLGALAIVPWTLVAYIAASLWTQFDSLWLIAGMTAPLLAVWYSPALSEKLFGEKPGLPHKVLLILVATACSFVGAYMSFVVVSSIWNHTSIVEGLCAPSRVQAIASVTTSGQSTTTLFVHCALSAGATALYLLYKLREWD